MRKEIKDILDAEASKEKRLLVFSLVGAFGLFIIIYYVDTIPFSSSTILGVTKSLSAVHTDEGARIIVSVELESGKTIVAGLNSVRQFQKDQEAEFLQRRTMSGRTSYKFIKYVD